MVYCACDNASDNDGLLLCREEYLAKIEKRIKTYDFQILNEPRADKLLLVLDVDYTLFGEYLIIIIIIREFI